MLSLGGIASTDSQDPLCTLYGQLAPFMGESFTPFSTPRISPHFHTFGALFEV